MTKCEWPDAGMTSEWPNSGMTACVFWGIFYLHGHNRFLYHMCERE